MKIVGNGRMITRDASNTFYETVQWQWTEAPSLWQAEQKK